MISGSRSTPAEVTSADLIPPEVLLPSGGFVCVWGVLHTPQTFTSL